MYAMHEVDYKIHGDGLQSLEVEIDPQEPVVVDTGSTVRFDDGIAMQTICGNGSPLNAGLMGALLGGGKR